MSDPYTGELFEDMTHGARTIHSQDVSAEHVIIRQTPRGKSFVTIQALCLDASKQIAVPVRALDVFAAKTGQFAQLSELPGYNSISSDSINFLSVDEMDGLSHQLVSLNDVSHSTVFVINDANNTFSQTPAVSIPLPFDNSSNLFLPKSLTCFETVEMQTIRSAKAAQLQELKEAMSDDEDQGNGNNGPKPSA